jgi:hypothetical protein
VRGWLGYAAVERGPTMYNLTVHLLLAL